MAIEADMIAPTDIARLHLGHFTMPEDTATPGARVVVDAFLIRHPRGVLLFDTGIGSHPDADARYQPVRRTLEEALGEHGLAVGDVDIVANSHLHVDHGGGNHRFARVPIFAQRVEHESAQRDDYTAPEQVADFPGATFELLDGEAEVLPGVTVVPTPGHVPGHQSLVVETKRGRVVLAGQAMKSASDFATAHYSGQLDRRGEPHGPYPDWISVLDRFDPWRVLFAHDLAVWERPDSPARVPSTDIIAPPHR